MDEWLKKLPPQSIAAIENALREMVEGRRYGTITIRFRAGVVFQVDSLVTRALDAESSDPRLAA